MSHLLALDVGWGTTLAIKTLIVLAIVPLTALILGYVFLLKMMSHMQSRLGPMDPGGFHGWYQLLGDGIKFMQKEDIMPAEADVRVACVDAQTFRPQRLPQFLIDILHEKERA